MCMGGGGGGAGRWRGHKILLPVGGKGKRVRRKIFMTYREYIRTSPATTLQPDNK